MTAVNENWFLLMDPSWAPEEEEDVPPPESVVGVWPVADDGRLGRFRSNPGYVPADVLSPSDPVDAGLRLMLRNDGDPEQLQLLIRDSTFDIAMNGDGRPLIVKSPDDIDCVVLATAEVHRRRVASPLWRRIDVEELVDMLADGVDVLFNPGGDASARLIGDFIRAARVLSDDEVAAAYTRFREQGLGLLGAEPGEHDENDENDQDGEGSPR